MMSDQEVPVEVVEDAIRCYAGIATTTRELIAQKFRLGQLVHEALQQRKYGDGVVQHLATALSRSVGKTIAPARLYEAARVYSAFHGNIEKVWELDRTLSFPLTYSFLVRHCVPAITAETAWNREELARVEEAKLEHWERTVLEIETQAPASAGNVQLAGFQVAVRESPPYGRFAVRTLLATLKRLTEQVVRRASDLGTRDWEDIESITEELLALQLAKQAGGASPQDLAGPEAAA